MEISFCPQCGTRRLQAVCDTGWKWLCLDCLSLIGIVEMSQFQREIHLIADVVPIPEIDIELDRLFVGIDSDKEVSL